MNYFPFTFAKTIHDEKIAQILAARRRHNDGFMPRPPLRPNPLGLFYQQILNALDKGRARIVEAIFHAVPADQAAGTRKLTVDPKRQPLASTVAKQVQT